MKKVSKCPVDVESNGTPAPHFEEFQGRNNSQDAGSMTSTEHTPDDYFGIGRDSDLLN